MKNQRQFNHAESGDKSQHPKSWLDRLILAWIFVMVAAAPHSIAATQIAWMCGMLFWVVRLIARPRFNRTPIDYALLCFLGFTVISAFTSYAPSTSIGKLRAVSLFTIIYLVAENVKTRRVVRLLALTLIASCMVNVVFTLVERAVGRGVKLEGVSITSPFNSAVFHATNGQTATGIKTGDILLEANGKKISSLKQVADELAETSAGDGPVRIKIYRAEWTGTYEMPRGSLLSGPSPEEKLGISSWSRGRDWRAAGFYGHYVTYAEALQLIAALAFGLLIALCRKLSIPGALLAICFIGFGLALLLTVTRAPQLGFLISAIVIVVAGVKSRRKIFLLSACILPLLLAAMFVVQQKRQISFFDRSDGSISWRETVWREGVALLLSSPRHMVVGVGMDSIKVYGCQWGLFDNCKLPIGHMHSTPLQLALERGIPAALSWLVLVGIYADMLWGLSRRREVGGWIEKGIVLGALGGLAGFFTSGLVHYNFGDSEVVMIFFIIMGLTLSLERQARVAPSMEENPQPAYAGGI